MIKSKKPAPPLKPDLMKRGILQVYDGQTVAEAISMLPEDIDLVDLYIDIDLDMGHCACCNDASVTVTFRYAKPLPKEEAAVLTEKYRQDLLVYNAALKEWNKAHPKKVKNE